MAQQYRKPKVQVATVDCILVTLETADGECAVTPLGFDTANQIQVEVQMEEQEAVKLIVKGILRAQKRGTSTITGHQITLHDNVFNPELVLLLQGGQIVYDDVDTDKIIGYDPPVSGSSENGEAFTLNAYTVQTDHSGDVIQYEKISYPNCHGVPVAFSSEDNVFRAPEYTITSAPKQGEPPYVLRYVDTLPTLVE